MDVVFAMKEADGAALRERMLTRRSMRQLSYMKELGMGNNRYILLDIDHEDQPIQPADAASGLTPFVELPETARRREAALAALAAAEEKPEE